MKPATENKLALFAFNTQAIHKEFAWQNSLTKRLAALLYALEDRPVDCEAIRQCHALIKQNTGAFSAFRGDMALCVATLLSQSPDPQGLFGETLKVYDLLKSARLRASDYLVIAAYLIAARSDPAGYANAVNRTRAFYDGMKARHFFRTGEDDYIFAAMLGLADLHVESGMERIEWLCQRLQGDFRDKNSVQTLAQVLVLGGCEDVDRVLALRDALRAHKLKLDQSYTLPALGLLVLLPVRIDAIVRDIGEAKTALRAHKGFGSLSASTEEVLLFAAGLVAGTYAQSVQDGVLTATISTSIVNIIVAQETAAIVAITASTTAATS